MTPDLACDEGQGSAGTAAQIEKTAGARQCKSRNVVFELRSSYPRVLADVFAIGFQPELPHQRRIKVLIEVVITSVFGSGWILHKYLMRCRSLTIVCFINPFQKGGLFPQGLKPIFSWYRAARLNSLQKNSHTDLRG